MKSNKNRAGTLGCWWYSMKLALWCCLGILNIPYSLRIIGPSYGGFWNVLNLYSRGVLVLKHSHFSGARILWTFRYSTKPPSYIRKLNNFYYPGIKTIPKKHGDLAGLAPTDRWETPSGTETLRLSILSFTPHLGFRNWNIISHRIHGRNERYIYPHEWLIFMENLVNIPTVKGSHGYLMGKRILCQTHLSPLTIYLKIFAYLLEIPVYLLFTWAGESSWENASWETTATPAIVFHPVRPVTDSSRIPSVELWKSKT